MLENLWNFIILQKLLKILITNLSNKIILIKEEKIDLIIRLPLKVNLMIYMLNIGNIMLQILMN